MAWYSLSEHHASGKATLKWQHFLVSNMVLYGPITFRVYNNCVVQQSVHLEEKKNTPV